MLKLMKYEFRKTWFSKLIILIVTAIAEILFLVGFYGKFDNLSAIGTMLLVMTAMFGIMYVGVDSLLVLNKDLNTKQGYLIFMTPNNSFQILGSKIIENGLSIILASCFFLGLAWIDTSIILKEFGNGYNLMKLFQDMLNEMPVKVEFSFQGLALVFFGFVISWFAAVVFASFAIILSSTLLTGKKFNIILSMVIFFVITFVVNFLSEKVPYFDPYGYYIVRSLVELAFAAVVFFISAWIMERKLSL